MQFINPIEIDSDIIKLLRKIGTEYKPEIIPVIAESYAKEANCYTNVELKVAMDGGNIHYGWAIYKSLFFCEAERHAVWETNDEELIDITPNEKGFQQIMFVSDNVFIYEGQYVDNIRVNTTDNSIIDDLIIIYETLGRLYSYSKRVDDENVIVSAPVMMLISYYQELQEAYLQYIYGGGGINKVCFCGSSKIYKNCHSILLKNNSKKINALNKTLNKSK